MFVSVVERQRAILEGGAIFRDAANQAMSQLSTGGPNLSCGNIILVHSAEDLGILGGGSSSVVLSPLLID